MRKRQHRLPLLAGFLLAAYVLTPHALAATTTLHTTVPSEHSIRLEITGRGRVMVRDRSYSHGDIIRVDRHRAETYMLLPDAGYTLAAIYDSGVEVTSLVYDGKYTASGAERDGILSVAFQKEQMPPAKPQTGDGHPIRRLWLAWGAALLVAAAIVAGKKWLPTRL